jgi:hypothetical protein
LEEADIRPHRTRPWLNPKIDDPEVFARQVQAVCDVYTDAAALEAQGTHVVSTDEKTGMQALECIAPTRPTAPGQVERREFEYERHGTLCLTANLHVATGQVIMPTLATTRTEEDFVEHVENTVMTDPDAGWVFVADNLNTHVSEAVVRLVAGYERLDVDLGQKNRRGILKDMDTRRAFLSDPTHRVRFVFTPKHCSWLNQVEIWFSILARRVLRRGSFTSLDDLRANVVAFIDYFNRLLAKPFRWTYTGRLLAG